MEKRIRKFTSAPNGNKQAMDVDFQLLGKYGLEGDANIMRSVKRNVRAWLREI